MWIYKGMRHVIQFWQLDFKKYHNTHTKPFLFACVAPLPPARGRARVLKCAGMSDAWTRVAGGGGRAAGNKPTAKEFLMSAMLAMAHWTRETERRYGKITPRESDRAPGLFGSVLLAGRVFFKQIRRLTPKTDTDSSMRALTVSFGNLKGHYMFMLRLSI